MTDPTPRTCRGCAAAIVWGITINAKRMPLDAEPVSVDLAVETGYRGLFTFAEDSDNIVAAGPLEPGLDLYRSHYATCPRAGSFRRA